LEVSVEVGIKLDSGKTRFDLIDWSWFKEVAEVLTKGAVKYSPDNWKKVENLKDRYTAALFRHMSAWLLGEELDPEDGLSHLSHASCNLMFLDWYRRNAPKELDSAPKM